MRSFLLFAALFLYSSSGLLAQRMGILWEYAHPYQAEAIRLGGAYSAVGRGLATMHSNTAALGFQLGTQLQFSSGRSLKLEDVEFSTPYTIAAAVHIHDLRTTIGIAIDNDEWILERRDETGTSNAILSQNTRLGIHLARQMSDWLSLGMAIRQHREHLEALWNAREGSSVTAIGWDLSFSAHGRHGAAFLGRPSDEIRYGITIDNLLGTEIWYLDERYADPLHQVLRAGAAYFWHPDLGHFWGADILSALVTVETSLQGTKHEFRNWGTIAGAAELRIMEVLMVSAGIENIIRLGNGYSYWPEYPVLRYGVGLDLPLARIFQMNIPFTLQLDYAHTKWDSKVEEVDGWNPADHPQQVNAFSIELRTGLF